MKVINRKGSPFLERILPNYWNSLLLTHEFSKFILFIQHHHVNSDQTRTGSKKMWSSILISVLIFVSSHAQESPKQCEKSETTVSGTHAPKKICSGDLIFEDNFEKFDLTKWQHEITLGGGGNGEFQWYTNNRSNSYVTDGILHIRPTLVADDYGNDFLYTGTVDLNQGNPDQKCTNDNWNGCIRTGTTTKILNPIKSARIRSFDSFGFTYGKVEIRAKIPSGDWLWPALWMLPRWDKYSTWPASGEIDILESRGNKQLEDSAGTNIGSQQVQSNLHWGPDYFNNRQYLTHYVKNNKSGFDKDFHNYQLEWTKDGLTFSIDDEIIGTTKPPAGGFWELGGLESSGLENPWKNSKMAPFDQHFYIVINLAIGGGFFPDNAKNTGGKPWRNNSPKAMTNFWRGKDQWLPTWNMDTDMSHLKIDYVKVWAI